MKPTLVLLTCLFATTLDQSAQAQEPGRSERGASERSSERGRLQERSRDGERPPGFERERAPAAESPKPDVGPSKRPAPTPKSAPQPSPKKSDEAAKPSADKCPENCPDKCPDPKAQPDKVRADGKSRQPGSQHASTKGDPRSYHLHEAIKHLRAAGLNEMAGLLEAQVKTQTRPHPGHPGRTGSRHLAFPRPGMMKHLSFGRHHPRPPAFMWHGRDHRHEQSRKPRGEHGRGPRE